MDIRTLIISSLVFLGSSAITLLLVSVRERERDAPGLGWLAAAFGSCTVGAALGAARGQIPDLASIVAGNAVFMVGYLLMHRAVLAFLGRPLRVEALELALLAAFVAGALYFTYVENDAQPRIILFSTIISVQAARSALLLLRAEGDEPERGALRWVGAGIGALAALNLARAVLTAWMGAPADFMRRDGVQAVSLLAFFVMTEMIGFGFLWMTSARLRSALDRQANQDELTGLLNRRGFIRRAVSQRREAERDRRRLLLVFADLDGLKQVNDTAGHAAGDQLLRDAAGYLRQALPASAALARLGGDEFCALVAVETREQGDALLERVTRRDGRGAPDQGRAAVRISAAGILIEPDENDSLDELLATVDDLMYVTKRARKRSTPVVRYRD